MTSVSSNGSSSVVIWGVGHSDSDNDNAITLYAFNGPTGAIIYSGVAGHWPNTNGTANIVPVVANGHVYVATYQGLAIYGLSSGPAALPTSPKQLSPMARVTLKPGQHEVFGMVTAINGTVATVAKRDGTVLKVEMRGAMASQLYAQATVGHGIIVRGKFTGRDTMTADSILHGKDKKLEWPSDR
jgi:hypothetical protein